MAVPSVANVYPNFAHVGGESLIRILGGDFRTRPSFLAEAGDFVTIVEGALPPFNPRPTVEVRFGAAVSPSVIVINHALMFARVPATALDVAGPVDLTVQNLDDEGLPIPGESVTVPGAFTYRQVTLTEDSTLVRVVRAFIRMLRRQVLHNTTIAQSHTDYDASTGDSFNLTELQELPSLVIMGPELSFESEPDAVTYTDAFGRQVRQRTPYTADLSFQIIGAADRHVVLINLQSLLVTFLRNNPYLELDRDPNNPSAGKARFELVFDQSGAPSISAGGDENNVKTFGARVRIEQVPIAGLPGFNQEGAGALEITSPIGALVNSILLNVTKL